MQNNNNQKKTKKSTRQPRVAKAVAIKERPAPAAKGSSAVKVGMTDLKSHRVSWITGYTYVGNGTIGATDEVLMQLTSGSSYVNASAGSGVVPVLGSDTVLGKSYVSDVEKHFARKRITSCKLHLVSLQPSTANSMVAYVAPFRGPGPSGDTIYGTGTTAGPVLADVLSSAGAKSAPSWGNLTLDLTPYIPGGSGPKQNEFALNKDGDDASTNWGTGNTDLTMVAPCSFVVSGSNSTSGLRGTRVHMIIIEQVVDLLDFTGGVVNPYPYALTDEEREAREMFDKLMKTSSDSKLLGAWIRLRSLEEKRQPKKKTLCP
jgi:hypothetical protein